MGDQAAPNEPVVVALPAEIDVTNSEEVYAQLMAALTPGVSAVIADMMATVFCDSSGVHAIMHAQEPPPPATSGCCWRCRRPPRCGACSS